MASCQVTDTTLLSMYHQQFSPRQRRQNIKQLQKLPTINNGEDILSPLPNCKVSSPCGSPRIPPLRHRSYTIDSSCTVRPAARGALPKDPIQPKHGSISDIRMSQSVDTHTDDEEEDELFLDLPPIRNRSLTCPDSIASRRHLKVRSLRRPSTPPPEDLCTSLKNMAVPNDIDKQIDILVKLKDCC